MAFGRHIACGVAAVMLVASGCSFGESDVGAAEPDLPAAPQTVVRIASDDIPDQVDPASINPLSATEVFLAEQLFDGLTAIGPEGDVIAELATDWESADGVIWTFTLDDGAVFSDGSPVSADAVTASLVRVKDRANSLAGLSLGVVKEISAATESTIELELASENWELPRLLASPALGIVPVGFDANASITSGPYELDGAIADATLIAVADADIDRIEIVAARDDVEAASMFEAGDVEMAVVSDYEKNDDESVEYSLVSNTTIFLGARQGADGLSDAESRRMLAGLIDREELVKGALPSAAVAPALSPLATMTAACADLCDVESSGEFSGGEGLVVDYLTTETMANLAGAVALQAGALGVGITLEAKNAAEMKAAIGEPESGLVLFAVTGVSPTPDTFLSSAFRSGGLLNILGLSSDRVDDLLDEARTTRDDDERTDAYIAVERELIGKGWALPIAQVGKTVVARSDAEVSASDLFGSDVATR